MIVAYIDGAESQTDVACGLVVLHKDLQIEQSHRMVRHENTPRGLCEFYALIKLVQWVVENRIPFEQVSVYSDCQKVTQAQFVLHKENYVRSERQAEMMRNVVNSCKGFINDPGFVYVLRDFINSARFTWVKGHKNTVYNQRADYLAYSCLVAKDPQPYYKWVTQGFCLFENGYPYSWYPPFSKEEK